MTDGSVPQKQSSYELADYSELTNGKAVYLRVPDESLDYSEDYYELTSGQATFVKAIFRSIGNDWSIYQSKNPHKGIFEIAIKDIERYFPSLYATIDNLHSVTILCDVGINHIYQAVRDE